MPSDPDIQIFLLACALLLAAWSFPNKESGNYFEIERYVQQEHICSAISSAKCGIGLVDDLL